MTFDVLKDDISQVGLHQKADLTLSQVSGAQVSSTKSAEIS